MFFRCSLTFSAPPFIALKPRLFGLYFLSSRPRAVIFAVAYLFIRAYLYIIRLFSFQTLYRLFDRCIFSDVSALAVGKIRLCAVHHLIARNAAVLCPSYGERSRQRGDCLYLLLSGQYLEVFYNSALIAALARDGHLSLTRGDVIAVLYGIISIRLEFFAAKDNCNRGLFRLAGICIFGARKRDRCGRNIVSYLRDDLYLEIAAARTSSPA